MTYSKLIQFDPIDEIIKFDKLESDDYRAKLVKNFVCSTASKSVSFRRYAQSWI